MLFLNLLPSKFKKEIKFQELFRTVLKAGNVLMFATLIIAATFYISSKILDNFYEVVNNTNFLMRTHVENPVKVDKVNRKIKDVQKIQNNSFKWANSLQIISHHLPRNVYIESLKIDREKSEVSIEGIALTRQSLVYLKENLQNSQAFTNIDFPIDNILKKENIHFDITVKLRESKLE